MFRLEDFTAIVALTKTSKTVLETGLKDQFSRGHSVVKVENRGTRESTQTKGNLFLQGKHGSL